jgi:AAHS family 4-hydroxybenzoate transporter-like MFS transporter
VVVLCSFPVFMDGFDATSLPLGVPALARDWAVAPAAFTLPLVTRNIGVVVGYLASGWMAKRVGRRRLLVGSAALFSVGTVMTAVGAGGLFWSAGLVSAVTAILLPLFLPPERTRAAGVTDGPRGERVGQLFERTVRVDTILLWAFAFLAFVVQTALSSWLPVLLTDLGFSVADAPLGLAFIYLGAVVGGVTVIPLAAWLGTGRMLIVISSLATVCLLFTTSSGLAGLALLLLLGVAGAGISGSQSGQVGVAVALYPSRQRTTGIGWASAPGLPLGLGASASVILSLGG